VLRGIKQRAQISTKGAPSAPPGGACWEPQRVSCCVSCRTPTVQASTSCLPVHDERGAQRLRAPAHLLTSAPEGARTPGMRTSRGPYSPCMQAHQRSKGRTLHGRGGHEHGHTKAGAPHDNAAVVRRAPLRGQVHMLLSSRGLGVRGTDAHGLGVRGTGAHGLGVRGTDAHGLGVRGTDAHGLGVRGTDAHGLGVGGTDERGRWTAHTTCTCWLMSSQHTG